jgi:RNA polymerase sigma-70 factor (ECF subfamily)
MRPFSSLAEGSDEPAVDPDRFAKEGRWAGFWTAPPSAERLPEASVLASEMGTQLFAAIEQLPTAQRAVLELRDVQGFGADEVCELLEISSANQRVLLHRARSKARAIVEGYVGSAGGSH